MTHHWQDAVFKDVCVQLRARPVVHACFRFGSSARGECDRFSDLDLGVVVEDSNLEDLACDLQWLPEPRRIVACSVSFNELGRIKLCYDDFRRLDVKLWPASAPSSGTASFDQPIYWQGLELGFCRDDALRAVLTARYPRPLAAIHQESDDFRAEAVQTLIERFWLYVSDAIYAWVRNDPRSFYDAMVEMARYLLLVTRVSPLDDAGSNSTALSTALARGFAAFELSAVESLALQFDAFAMSSGRDQTSRKQALADWLDLARGRR